VVQRIFTTLVFMQLSVLLFSQNFIKGVVTDADNGESVIGCNILLQGTTIGTVTDFDGNYELKNVPAGTYNIIFSFISYDKNIQKVEIAKNTELKLDVKLKSSTQVIQDVVVTAQRRTDTELTMLTSTRKSLTIANGITSQQIARSQDKDASEVIRRIPGVTIREGKFVIVRGLTERYNSVWLNGTSTPSSESDVRAFSFDVIPSGQIDNILIYKTPAPELPADFAGAMINVKTKSLIDRNSISVSASVGFNQLSTGKTFYSSEGSKTDWLGYDKTVRVIPSTVPSTEDYKNLFDQTNAAKKEQINSISKSFNTNLTPYITVAKPDADLQLGINRRFRLGDISIGTITALGYNSTTTSEQGFRAAYLNFPDTSYRYQQMTYQSKIRVSALSNWTFTFGDNQRIEFRNLFNNMGANRTVLKEGFDFYSQSNDRSYELGYESRLTYSSQLAGIHSFNSEATKLDWVVGYAYANKNQPDLRRVKATSYDTEPDTQYTMGFNTQGASDAFGRLFMQNNENILSAGLNFSHKINIDKFQPEIKAGVYFENKQREFNSRVFNYVKGATSSFYYTQLDTYNKTVAFDDAMFQSIKNVLNTKIDYNTGLVLLDASQKADSYNASNQLIAGYLAVNLPFTKWLNVYTGLRIEKNTLQLDGYERDGTDNTPINKNIDSLNVYPSLNTTININDKMMLRFAGGKTVNRPEFREISPFVFFDFENNVTIYGNPLVRNSYITNVDARYEWYPTAEEIISLGVFYKHFKDPIESKILYTGSGWNYTFDNAEKAQSYGIEFDARKRLHEFEKSGSLKFLSNLTFVVNASIIKSIILTDSIIEGESQRVLQGQSPYIVNFGVYYNDTKNGLMGSAMYNKAGKRIAIVGDKDIPHIYEMPFNSLDFTFEKKIFEKISIKFGIKNMLDGDVVFQQFQKYKTPTGEAAIREQVTNKFKPGRQFKLGVSVSL
jgi:TonB-dependent receptor